ncbi:alpha/beta hydrolase [uncultured Paenibacillus sp.]|uniref:alpha/beta hydrolase n=1 Tax=uncultured Paenibacillus sp. TaxID=227322 RepID=UPI0015B18C6E|nr:alpha/beta hydrolase [uncultured Paenibacillus sp.]
MKATILKFPSHWNAEISARYVQVAASNRKLVVLFPGKNYSCEKPTLHYAGLAARECGYDILALEYGYQAARTELEYREIPQVIEDCERAVRQLIDSYEEIVFISKSLGTVVAGEVHRKLGAGAKIRQIYLTPIPDTLPYIHGTRAVVVYGTKDDLFPAELASRLKASNQLKVVAIAGANHGLETERAEESLEILRELTVIYIDVLREAEQRS